MLATPLTSTSQTRSNPMPRRKGPPAALRINTPSDNPPISIVLVEETTCSTLSSANSDMAPTLPYSHPLSKPNKPRSMKNMKNLSLALPPSHPPPTTHSLAWPSQSESVLPPASPSTADPPRQSKRRLSTLSLPNSNNDTSLVSRLHRKDEDESPLPYVDGPVQILPGVWLGSEDNARDWKCLMARGIKSILNVAKEVISPFDSLASTQPLRSVVSAPDLAEQCRGAEESATFYPAHGPSGRPPMHYLKLPWSHGQPDLVEVGFVNAMEFVDAALGRGDGVLIHCQCGVSRSATVVIALVMRAAAHSLSSAPPEVWALKNAGMHGAYSFVKEKSKCIGPNMSLIYQLLEYEHKLQRVNSSVSNSERSSAVAEEEEEWTRRRQMLDDDTASTDEKESAEVMREAQALDKAMEERIVARKASNSSMGSGGLGMGLAWKSRYGNGGRARTGSMASNFTSGGGSILSENLLEENEEEELLGVGGGFDCSSMSVRSPSEETAEEDSRAPSVAGQSERALPVVSCAPSPLTARPPLMNDRPTEVSTQPPPSAPATKTTFGFTPRLPFRFRSKRRQPSLGVLPPVPSSPIVSAPPPAPEPRKRETKRVPPPLRLENSTHGRTASLSSQSSLKTASQTLFVFPPSPTFTTQTPSTVTLTSSMNLLPRHAALCTPRVSSFNMNGRRRSFIGLGIPPTPTTACSRVDVRGWVGIGPS